MPTLKNTIVLALALLLSQTAVAVHDIHCLDGEHEQSCEIYFSQDNSASTDTQREQLERIVYKQKPEHFTSLVSPTTFISFYLTRAPPQKHF